MMLGLMWLKKSSRRKGLTLSRRRRLQVVVAVALVLGLFAAWTMLAYSGALDSFFRQKSKRGGTVSTASFNSNSPSKEYVYAGGRLVATEEPTGSSTGSATAPTNLNVTANTVGQINLSWNWSPAAGETLDHFIVERSQTINGSPVTFTSTSTTFPDSLQFGSVSSIGGVTPPVVTYLYRVKAVNTAGSTSNPGNFDLVTTISFAQDPIQKHVTIINKQDLAELRV